MNKKTMVILIIASAVLAMGIFFFLVAPNWEYIVYKNAILDHNFDCKQSSVALYKTLTKNGYDAQILAGMILPVGCTGVEELGNTILSKDGVVLDANNFDECVPKTCHTWVELVIDGKIIWVESTNGTWFLPSEHPEYFVIDKNATELIIGAVEEMEK